MWVLYRYEHCTNLALWNSPNIHAIVSMEKFLRKFKWNLRWCKFNVGRFSYHTLVTVTFDLQVKVFTHQPPSNDGGWFLVVYRVLQFSYIFYSVGPSNTIGYKLWLLNCVRLGGRNTWGFPKLQGFLRP